MDYAPSYKLTFLTSSPNSFRFLLCKFIFNIISKSAKDITA